MLRRGYIFLLNSTQFGANKQNANCPFFVMSHKQGTSGRSTPQASQAVLANSNDHRADIAIIFEILITYFSDNITQDRDSILAITFIISRCKKLQFRQAGSAYISVQDICMHIHTTHNLGRNKFSQLEENIKLHNKFSCDWKVSSLCTPKP